MKVLLISPSQSKIYGNLQAPDFPSLGLGYLGAILEKSGHNVKIIDTGADRVSEQDLIKSLKTEDYGLVGITTTTPTFNGAIRLSRLIKDNSNAYTVLGGVHVTVMPEEAIKFDSVDFVIKGEGERTIVELVDYLEGRRPLESVDGIYYRRDGKVLKNKDRALITNLDEIPFPARHLFNHQNYSYPDTLFKLAFPIITSRGCPGRCNYCSSNSIYGQRFRTRSPENIVDEIEYLIGNFGAKEIHFWDDNFVTVKANVLKIQQELKRRNIKVKFSCPYGLRADYVNEEILRVLKEMGVYSIAIGVESGSQKVLDRANKNVNLAEIECAFKLAKKIGLETWAFFIIGLLNETEDSIKDTIDFAKKIDPDVVKFHILKPFPGTEIYEELLKHNQILDNNFDNYGIHTPPVHKLEGLGADEILYWQKRAYRNFYLRPTILLKHVYRLKSIHRLKLNFLVGKSILKNMIR